MCVLHTKKLVIAYLFSFRETFYERPKNVPKWNQQRDVLGRSQDVNFNVFHKIGFYKKFSIVSDAKCIPDIAEPKNIACPILVLLWSGTSWPK